MKNALSKVQIALLYASFLRTDYLAILQCLDGNYGDRKYSDVVRGRWTKETAATATYPRYVHRC